MTTRADRGHVARYLGAAALAALAGCTNLNLLEPGSQSAGEPVTPTAAPPSPDSRGVISYPNYQVVRAQAGETPASIAARLEIDAEALALRNGLEEDQPLREGELLQLPVRVPTENDDLASLAGAALDRAGGTAATGGAAAAGTAPVRHTVARGETAYSIARLYDVSVRSLADWNGLPSDYTVREGQQLLIPTARGGAPSTGEGAAATGAGLAAVTAPGQGTATPTPPSASSPQPATDVAAPPPVETTPLDDKQTAASDTGRLAKPVSGRILRPYAKGRNEGVDFSASAGSAVKAADAGTVAAITRDVDQVPIIVIRHGGNLLTVYANVDGIKVARGDSVSRGQVIAAVRASDPAFLHFEVRDGFESVDPVDYLSE